MKFLTCALVAPALVSAVAVQNKVSYDGYRVFRLNIGEDRAAVSDVISKFSLATWKGKVETSKVVDVVVPPSQLQDFEAAAKSLNTEVMHEDLGASIAEETKYGVYAAAVEAAAPNATWFNSYHPIADHTQWLKDLAAAYPNNAEIFSAGKSDGGRDLTGIHIWGSGGKGKQKAVVWHGTVHAREWISNMVVEYATYQLLTSASSKTLLDKYDYYILPIVNPDGFAYTQSNDRLWRKNRQTTNSASCVGRDINRNWPNHWDQKQGASTSPCAEDYKGPSAGDGTETKALKAHLDGISSSQGVQFYLDVHSYSQLFMYPYGYTCSASVPDSANYSKIAQGAVDAIKAVHGTSFEPGPICTTIYQVSGDSVDYAYEIAKAKYAMTVELRDKGNSGFVLPADQILPSGEEMWAGLSYVLTNI